MGIIHQDFVIQKSYFNSLYDFYFSKRKTSPAIATNTELHFTDPGLSRPYKRKVPCWQIFHIVGTFHATSANFTQRRITLRVQTKRKTATNKSEYSFSKHKNPKQRPRDRTHSSKEELFYCDFHIKNRLQIKFIVFPTNNQP